jgi:hypothetical protein
MQKIVANTEHSVQRASPIVIKPEPRGPVPLNSRAGVPQAELAIVDRPAASIGLSKDHPPNVPAARLRAPHAVAERDDGDADGRFRSAQKSSQPLQVKIA